MIIMTIEDFKKKYEGIIKSDLFCSVFIQELTKIFPEAMKKADENNGELLNEAYIEGTVGWADALKKTCIRCKLLRTMWKDYNILMWDDSDCIDDVIGNTITAYCLNKIKKNEK